MDIQEFIKLMAALHRLPVVPESKFLTDCVQYAYGVGMLDGREEAEAEAEAAAANAASPIRVVCQNTFARD
jgi:hypothetical protein